MAFWVADPGPFTTLQDAGRYGFERFGVPVSGPMDWYACACANRLAGNAADAAVIEFGFQGPALTADREALVAVCGDCQVQRGRTRLPAWTAIRVRAGETLQMRCGPNGCWGYLAVAGGFEAPLTLGSRATYVRGGFGGVEGRTLRAGDRLFSRAEGSAPWALAGARLAAQAIPRYRPQVTVRAVAGPQADWFGEAGLEAWLGAEFTVHAGSDRMGYRLAGPAIPRQAGDLLSEGMPMGAIQAPPDGQPIVMMADRPTTGGYPKIGTVIRADLPLLAQLRPGEGAVRFARVSVEEAQAAYRALIGQMEIETDADELWMSA